MVAASAHATTTATASPPTVALTIGARLSVPADVPEALRWALCQRFTLRNPAYTEAERYQRSTEDLQTTLRYWSATPEGSLILPRGAAEAVSLLCQEHGHQVAWENQTHQAAPVAFTERLALSAAQELAVSQVLSRRMGVLVAPAGAGKTTIACVAIARRRQPALFVVHTSELAQQALRAAERVLGLTADEVGMIGGGKWSIGERLTIALVQSLQGEIPAELAGHVGHLIVDECHHAPAETFARVVAQFPARFLLGLSATPYRRDGLAQVINFYLGPVAAKMDERALTDRLIKPRILKRETGINVYGASFTDLVSQLTTDSARNRLIVGDVAQAVAEGRRCLLLSDRIEHVELLTTLLQAEGLTAAALHGQKTKRQRAQAVADAGAGDPGVLVATCALVGEGFDSPRLDALFLATPVSYEGRIVQYIGRVSRTAPGKTDAVVYDYTDGHPMLWASWRKRSVVYRDQRLSWSTLGAP